MNTEQHISPLNQALNISYNYDLLLKDSERYSKATNIDYRIYYLGLSLLKQVNNYKKTKSFYSLVATIDDYKDLWSKFTIKMLSALADKVTDKDVIKATRDVIELLEKYGEDIPKELADKAAWAAANATGGATGGAAAWAAASAAARDAEWAAWSAVESEIVTYEELLEMYLEILKER